MKHTHRLVHLGLAILLPFGTSCAEPPTCHDLRNCPAPPKEDASDGGNVEGSSASDALIGTDGPTSPNDAGASRTCTRTEDCDDNDPCNGRETCREGTCVPGAPPCENDDPMHCDNPCTANGGSHQCGGVKAADRDHDGHGSTGCKADPSGDDCDDENAAVHPGAKEICDGIDNDCNGQTDLSDGLVLSSSVRAWDVAATNISLAWAAEKNLYGISWLREGAVRFNAMDTLGHRIYADVSAIPVPDGGTAFDNGEPHISWGGDGFGLIWGRNGYAAFQRLDFTGMLSGTATYGIGTISYGFSIQRFPNGNWLLFGSVGGRGSVFRGRVINPTGTLSPTTYELGPGGGDAHVAISGNIVGVLKSEIGMPNGTDTLTTIRWMRRTANLDPLDDVTLARATTPARVGSPVIAGLASRFAVAWKETAIDGTKLLKFAEYANDGSKICGPVDLRKSFTADNPEFTPADMAAGDVGYAILSAVSQDAVSATFEVGIVGSGCQLLERFLVARAFDLYGYGASIAGAGSKGFAITYHVGSGQQAQVYAGAFGPHFCD